MSHPVTTTRRAWRGAGLLMSAFLIAVTAPVVGSPAAQDDIAFMELSTGNFAYLRNNIPDLDQFRGPDPGPPEIFGLPPRISMDDDGNTIVTPGGMYCVPTSAFNMLAYIANHGYPHVRPFPRDWEKSPADDLETYNLATLWIEFMGGLMGTDPQTGTGDARPTIQAMLDFDATGHFNVVRVWAQGSTSPSFEDMFFWAGGGALVNPTMGWYETLEGVPAIFHIGGFAFELTVPGVPLHIRRGGHVVSMSYANRNHFAPGDQIGMRDPALDEGNVFNRFLMQSPFETDVFEVQDEFGWFGFEDKDGNLRVWQRTQSRLPERGSARLDGFVSIHPQYGLVMPPDLGKIILLSPVQLVGWEKPPAFEVDIEDVAEVTSIAIDPVRAEHPFLARGSNSVWAINSMTLQTREIVPNLPQEPSDLVLGTPSRNLYLLLPGDRILRLPPAGELEQLTVLPRPVNARLPVDAMAWDESRNMLAVVSAENGRVRFFDPDLEPAGDFILPPGTLPSDHRRRDDGDRRISLSIQPRTGEIVTHRDGDRHATRLSLDPDGLVRGTMLPIPEDIDDPVDLHIDERGALYVTDSRTGLLNVFDGNGNELRDNPFHGLPGGRGLQISRSYSNFDPEVHTLPSFHNVTPEDALRER